MAAHTLPPSPSPHAHTHSHTHIHRPPLPHIQHHKELLDIFNKSVCGVLSCLQLLSLLSLSFSSPSSLLPPSSRTAIEGVSWTTPQASYPHTVKLLAVNTYCYPALQGLVVSVGDLTESTVSWHQLALCSSHDHCLLQVRHSSAALLNHVKVLRR